MAPPAPEIGVGPSADSVQSDASASPPSSLTTTFTSSSVAARSRLVIEQVASSPQPSETVSVSGSKPVAPEHDQSPSS